MWYFNLGSTDPEEYMWLDVGTMCLAFLIGWLYAERERAKTREAELALVFVEWKGVCEELLFFKLTHQNSLTRESCPRYNELWSEEGRLKRKFERLGGDPELVNFHRIHGDEWELYSNLQDIQNASIYMKQLAS